MPGVFITGTDTEIGKTQVTCALLNTLNKKNIKTAGMKPVASGAELDNERLVNEDAMKLIQASSVKFAYELVNPYVFKEPASPHISARLENRQIDLDKVVSCYKEIDSQTDFVAVEGVGGWLAPLSDANTVADMANSLELPVVMVVGMRLGCLNHALLTAQHIQQSNLKLVGWIANCVENKFPYLNENIKTLVARIDAPLIGRLGFNEDSFSPEYERSISLLLSSN